jgi:hypothetical protein
MAIASEAVEVSVTIAFPKVTAVVHFLAIGA